MFLYEAPVLLVSFVELLVALRENAIFKERLLLEF